MRCGSPVIPLLLACLVLPDSAAGLLFLVVVLAGWLLRAPGDVGWSTVVTALGVLLLHLASAYAAQLPSYAKVGPRSLRRWLLPASIAVAARAAGRGRGSGRARC